MTKSSIKYVINAQRVRDWDQDCGYVGETWLNNIMSRSISEAFNNKKWNLKKSKDIDAESGEYKGDYIIINKFCL